MAWEELVARLEAGDGVELTTESPLYKGPYSSTVVFVSDDVIRIAMPLVSGRLVLIPVGTKLQLRSVKGGLEARGVVTDRRGGRERYLEIRALAELPEPAGPQATAAEESEESKGEVPIIAVTSGKGGVGKTTLAVNIAVALEAMGKRTCIIDGDLGTANVDVLLKLTPPFNLGDVVTGKKHMVEVLVEGPHGLLVLPGGSGLVQLTRLSDELFGELVDQFRALERFADIIVLDTGSGVSPNVTRLVGAASRAVLVTTPEPHAVTDAYAMLRVLAADGLFLPTHLVVNRAHGDKEAALTAERMVYAARRFLHYELELLGTVREDTAVRQAIRSQTDLFTGYPRSRAARDVQHLAERLAQAVAGDARQGDTSRGGASAFLRRVRSLFSGRTGDPAGVETD